MTGFVVLQPEGDAVYADGAETVSRADLSDRVEILKKRLSAEGVAGKRIAIALDAGLGSLATLVAVIETGTSAALLSRPADDADITWPGFCDLALLPPGPGKLLDDLVLIHLKENENSGSDDHSIWLHSSGTTGTPKWILHDTGTLLENARACVSRLGLQSDDRVLIPVPIHHAFGLGAGLLPSLLAGAGVRLVARGNPLTVFQAQRSYDPTVAFMVPSQIRSILALGRKGNRSRLVVIAGDKLQPDEAALFEKDHGNLVNLYGSSEMGAMTAGRPDDPAEIRHLTAGPPLDGVELAIETESDPDPAREGAVSMKLKHNNGFRGYVDPSTGSLISPAPDVWPTGDLVRLVEGPDGRTRIEVLGRADHSVNRDGLLVHLGTIEGCLSRANGVALAAVVPFGQSRRGTGLVAFCERKKGSDTDAETILAHCRDGLPARAVPDRLEFLEKLPTLPSGKVDRRALMHLAGKQTSSDGQNS